MNMIRDVLKDCNITYYTIPSELPCSKSVEQESSLFEGISVDFTHVSMTVQCTYQLDFVSVRLRFLKQVTFAKASELADTIAKCYNVLNPPQLFVETKKSPNYIDFVIKCESKYKIAMFLIHLMNMRDDNCNSIL